MIPSRREWLVGVTLFAACVVLNLSFSFVGWSHNLREVHEFRQTQTAVTARYIQREGWALAAPLPLFGPPWSAPLEFPLYQVCTAAVSNRTGWPLESAGRFVSLTFFYLSLPAWYLLLGYLAIPPSRRWLFLALLLVSPVYLYYSRAFLIESAALCLSGWFLWCYFRASSSHRLSWVLATTLAGTAAALTKITTFAVFLVPAAAFTVAQWRLERLQNSTRPAAQLRTFLLAGIGIVVPIVVAMAWIRFADGVKMSNPLSTFLTSQRLHDWNYGTWSLRLNPNFWRTLGEIATGSVLQIGGLVVVGVGLAVGSARARVRIGVLLLCFASGPLIFANLYFLHDYYFYATGCFLLAAVVVSWNELLGVAALPALLRWATVVVVLALQLLVYTRGYFNVQKRGDIDPPELGRVFASVTNRDDILLMVGLAWNPGIAYSSDRRAIMVTDDVADNEAALDDVLGRVPPNQIGALVVAGPRRHEPEFVKRVIEKTQLNSRPVLESNDTVVFVAERLLATAIPRLETMRLPTLTRVAHPDAELLGAKVRRYNFADFPDTSAIDMFLPLPKQVLVPSGVSTAVVDGRKVFNAHTPSEVTIPLESTASTLDVSFGIVPEAYTDPNRTDGVLFRVDLVEADGATNVLFEKLLEPRANADDRGMMHASISLPPKAGGHLRLSTLPGRNNDFSFDWAYWTAVSLHP